MGLILSNSQHDLCDAKNEHTIAHVQGIKSEQILVCVSDPSVQEGWSLVVGLRIALSLQRLLGLQQSLGCFHHSQLG